MWEMNSLITEDVKPIYRQFYADKVSFDNFPSGLDWALKSRTGRATKALQKLAGAYLANTLALNASNTAQRTSI